MSTESTCDGGLRVDGCGMEPSCASPTEVLVQSAHRFREDMGVLAGVAASMETLMNQLDARHVDIIRRESLAQYDRGDVGGGFGSGADVAAHSSDADRPKVRA